MTNQANEYLMAYLTGEVENLESMQNPKQLLFEEFDNYENDLETYLTNDHFPYGYQVDNYIQGIVSSTEGTEYSIMYGKYKINSSDNYSHSFIVILDASYNIVQVITRYTNNELFGKILALNVGEDGRFFMVELDNNGYYRIVLLNNILIKSASEENYQVIMRQTYRITDQEFLNEVDGIKIDKHPTDAFYIIFGSVHSGSYYDGTFKVINFKINVGSENEWNYYRNLAPSAYIENYDYTITWNDEGKYKFNLIYVEKDEYEGEITLYLAVIQKDFNEEEFSYVVKFPPIIDDLPTSATIYTAVKYKDSNNYYITIAVNNNFYLYKNEDDGSTPEAPILQISNATYTHFQGIRLAYKNNNVFFTYENNSVVYVGIIIGKIVYTSQFPAFASNKNLFSIYVKNIFNLYFFYIQYGDFINIAKMPYIDDVNNVPYYYYNTLNPYFTKLYDENDKLIFARSLYDKSVNGQTTTSTIEVPNLYLNDVVIGGEKLIGETYKTITSNTREIEKNQYEDLFINISNTINIENQNDPNNVVLNPNGAAKLNIAITQSANSQQKGLNEYTNAKALKYVVNYSDNTYLEGSCTGSITSSTTEPPFTHTYHFNLIAPSDKEVLNIQILSNDKNTIYQTISNLDLEAGKLYEITQDVYVV